MEPIDYSVCIATLTETDALRQIAETTQRLTHFIESTCGSMDKTHSWAHMGPFVGI